jgi:putative phosphonate metabolism protein
VSTGPRYAIYFVPAESSALYRFGAATLGYDCYTGGEVASSPDVGMSAADWTELTREPRTYGFHATLKAPFRLRTDRREADLVADFRKFAAAAHPAPVITPSIEALEDFIAIVPRQANSDLEAMAADCVRIFDHFRAPMTAEDRVRRLTLNLSPRQAANLDRWGYPYVLDDFRFHMTLTGRIDPEHRSSILARLREQFFRECGDHPVAIDGIALLRQDQPRARFRVIDHSLAAIS